MRVGDKLTSSEHYLALYDRPGGFLVRRKRKSGGTMYTIKGARELAALLLEAADKLEATEKLEAAKGTPMNQRHPFSHPQLLPEPKEDG